MFNPQSDQKSTNLPRYLRVSLLAAGVYNLVWGLAVILFPMAAFRMFDMELPRYPQIWQCVGMIVGVYGFGYLIASRNPVRHWAIVLVGFLGKIFGPIGFLSAAISGDLPWSWGLIILFNDLIWWVPFGHALYLTIKHNTDSSLGRPHELMEATNFFPSQHGITLDELSQEQPVMVVFLRHFGCTFCREAIDDLAAVQQQIEQLGFKIALVHMSSWEDAEKVLAGKNLSGLHHFSDPNCEIYRAFGLKRGNFLQLFGPQVWWRGVQASLNGHMVGKLAGDGFRMPGVFYLFQGEIWGSVRHRTAADRPDYVGLSKQLQELLQSEAVLN